LVQDLGTGGVWAVYEASGCGFGLHDELREQGWKVSVVAPTHLARSMKEQKTKTDLRDATKLQGLLMSHGELQTPLTTVWVPPVKIREDRELVRRRLKVAENLSRVKTGIGSLLRMHGIQKPEDLKTAWTQKHVAWVKGLSQHAEELAWTVRTALASQVRELEFYRGEIDELDAQIEKLQQEEGYATAAGKMREIPGVGRLTAMTFLVELGDVKRFKNRRQLASYLGLTPNCYESGEASDRKGHISRMGPARIRKVLNQAALCLLRLDPTWKPWYDQLSRRRGTKRAIVATMRRLGIAMWQKARTA